MKIIKILINGIILAFVTMFTFILFKIIFIGGVYVYEPSKVIIIFETIIGIFLIAYIIIEIIQGIKNA